LTFVLFYEETPYWYIFVVQTRSLLERLLTHYISERLQFFVHTPCNVVVVLQPVSKCRTRIQTNWGRRRRAVRPLHVS
jgi:hypothetical protein